jgi:hypothetical protein
MAILTLGLDTAQLVDDIITKERKVLEILDEDQGGSSFVF